MKISQMEDCCMLNGTAILKERRKKNITQIELAEEVGTAQYVICDMESGVTKHKTSVSLLCRIAKFFEKPIEFFLKDTTTK